MFSAADYNVQAINPPIRKEMRHPDLTMLARIIFFAAVSAATLAVILLPLLSPVRRKSEKNQSGPWLALSIYIHPPSFSSSPHQQASLHGNSAFVFHHKLREGPANTSRIIGKARGIVVPLLGSELSAFNIVHLALDAPAYSGSLSVEAKQVGRRGRREEELVVVGGTGAFAYARGHAVFTATSEAIYHLDLRLRFPGDSPAIPG